MYYSIGRNDVEIVDLLKAHYDTNVYGFRYVMIVNMQIGDYDLSNYHPSVSSLKRRRKEWGLLSTRQQKHTLESIAGPLAEIRKRYPNRGRESMKKALLIEYKMKVPRSV